MRTSPIIVDLVGEDSSREEQSTSLPSNLQRSASAPLREGAASSHGFERANTIDWPISNGSSSRRRPNLPDNNNQFKLFNLSNSTTAESIRHSMIAAEISMAA